jgi:hypothetical protein
MLPSCLSLPLPLQISRGSEGKPNAECTPLTRHTRSRDVSTHLLHQCLRDRIVALHAQTAMVSVSPSLTSHLGWHELFSAYYG